MKRKSKTASRRAQWRKFSKEFRAASGNVCAVCGSDYGVCVHHCLYKKTHPAFWFEPMNLICLCRSCHWKVHRGFEWEFAAWMKRNRPGQFEWLMEQAGRICAQVPDGVHLTAQS